MGGRYHVFKFHKNADNVQFILWLRNAVGVLFTQTVMLVVSLLECGGVGFLGFVKQEIS